MKGNRFSEKNGLISGMGMKSRSVRVAYWSMFSFCILLVLICVIPPLFIMLSSLKDIHEFYQIPPTVIPKTLELDKIVKVWKATDFGTAYLNSGIVIIGCVASTLLFNGMAGYALAILKPKGYKLAFGMVLFSLMMPTLINIVPVMSNLTRMGLLNNYLPLWLGFGCNAFQIVLFKSFFDGIPSALIEASRLDGCNALRTFSRIVLPMSKPIVMVVSILTVNSAWSDFLMPFLVLRDERMKTVMVKIYTMTNFPKDQQMVALLFAILPPAIIFIFFSKYFTEGVAIGSVKG